MITLQQFQTTPYRVNLVTAVDEQVYNGSVPENDLQVEHHRVRHDKWFSSVDAPGMYVGVRNLNIGAGNDTVYLPYYVGMISSVKLPDGAGPNFFVTDNMSGCAFYIGRNPAGDLYAFHANSQQGSSAAVMKSERPSFQGPTAANELDGQVTYARRHHGPMTIVGGISKSAYLHPVDAVATRGDQFNGSTAIAGWRNGTQWEFWFQNWGAVGGIAGAVQLIACRKFFG
jgi:hypothetical protein